MTNETSYAPIKYVCNGVSVDFVFPWKIFEEKDLIVQIQDSDGNITDLVLGVDYNIEFDEVGGNVKLNQTYAEGDLVVISRNVSDYQSKSFSTSSGFQASEIEESLDKVSCNLQEMEYNIENFKETFSETVNQEIDTLEGVIEENKQEVLVIQERFEDEVNTKIQEVSEAAGKINALEQAVLDAQTSADNAQASANEALAQKEDLISEGEKLVEDVSKEVARVEDVVEELDKNIDKIIKHVSFDLGDTKITDHILEGDEAIGWALQGIYIYKNGGTNRVGYPDFYNKYLGEYKDSNNEIIGSRTDSGIAWTQPINPEGITSQGWNNPNNIFDGDDSTYSEIPAKTQGYIEYDFGQYLSVSGFETIGKWASSQVDSTNFDIFAVDSNGVETLLGTSSGSANTSTYTTTCTFEPVICNKVRFRIPSSKDLTYKFRIASIAITANTTTGYATYKNPNGHQFYNIIDKPVIDEIYNQYGIADFYGIDEENERIFLPRNKYFAVKGTALGAGDGKTLELTNGTDYGAIRAGGTNSAEVVITKNGYGAEAGGNVSAGNHMAGAMGVTTDPEKSGIIAHLQPNENKYLYYCVGNTQVTSAVTNVTEITTSENDTLPWGYNFYSGDLLEAPVGYVESLGQWNRGKEWQSFYDRAVAKIGQPFASGYIKEHTETYNDYDLVINQDEMTFRLPLLNGEEDVPDESKAYNIDFPTMGETVNLGFNAYVSLSRRASAVGGWLYCGTAGYAKCVVVQAVGAEVSQSFLARKNFTVNGGDINGEIIRSRVVPCKGNGTLYFKLANAVQNLELLNVGEVMEGLADKISRQDCKAYITETYQNGASGYNLYSNNYIIQWSKNTYRGNTAFTVSLLKKMRDTDYQLHITPHQQSTNEFLINRGGFNLTTNSFDVIGTSDMPFDWIISGYIA